MLFRTTRWSGKIVEGSGPGQIDWPWVLRVSERTQDVDRGPREASPAWLEMWEVVGFMRWSVMLAAWLFGSVIAGATSEGLAGQFRGGQSRGGQSRGGQSRGGQGAPDGQEGKKGTKVPEAGHWAFRQDHLEGGDERLGSLAALTLLQASGSTDPTRMDLSRRHREFVLSQLGPQRFSLNAGHEKSETVPRRIVEGMAALTASSGPPFTEAGKVLLALLGRGSSRLRTAVVDALVAHVLWEETRSPPREPGVKNELRQRIVHNPPPSESELEDASRILWRCDGKLFLASCIRGMERNRERFPESTDLYLKEIRHRLRIDFPSPEEWVVWWERQKVNSLSQIFAECQRLVSRESAHQWRQVMKRLRETLDAEGVLATVSETLRVARGLELRLAAVVVLGDFPDWVRDVRITENGVGKVPAGDAPKPDPRDRLMSQAVKLLLETAQGEAQLHERAEVRRSALGALRKYQTFLERKAEFRAPISQLVLQRFEALLESGEKGYVGARRDDLLEVLRTAGALGILEAREHVETFVRSSLRSDDLELLTAGAAALGRLVRGGLALDTARLYFRLFKLNGDRPVAEVKELRRACVAALNARPQDAAARQEIREFHAGILGKGADELRIPAILGLGTLAQDRDEEALKVLVDVVARHAGFEAQEVMAALNAIAYVGGLEVLGKILPLLGVRDGRFQNKAVYDHLWRTVVGLVKREGPRALPWSIARLEELAMGNDSLLYLEVILPLSREPELRPFLATDQLDLDDRAHLSGLWRTTLSQAWTAEVLAYEGELPVSLRRLEDLQNKNGKIREVIPAEVAALAAHRDSRKKRRKVREMLQSGSAIDPQTIVKELQALIEAEKTPADRWYGFRWIEAQLAHPTVKKAAKAPGLYGQWSDLLKSEGKDALFAGLPASFRANYLRRVEALVTSSAPPPADAKSPDAKSGGGDTPPQSNGAKS